jgi:hypothetical protein
MPPIAITVRGSFFKMKGWSNLWQVKFGIDELCNLIANVFRNLGYIAAGSFIYVQMQFRSQDRNYPSIKACKNWIPARPQRHSKSDVGPS